MLILFYFVIVGTVVACAAKCNAKMDTVRDHYSSSIYGKNKQKYPDMWFDPSLSWHDKYQTKISPLQENYLPFYLIPLAKKKPGWAPISDFWHVEKSRMIAFMLLGQFLSLPLGHEIYGMKWGGVIALSYIAFLGTVWIQVFDYYYDRKLKG